MSTKRILIINGHPDSQSFCRAITGAYERGAKSAGHEVNRLHIRALKFDPILHDGYRVIQALEPDLARAQELIKWADHLVFVFPTWWSGLPALTKGFVDRVFLPGFGFHYRKDSPLWDKLLKGKSARLFITMDAPVLFNWLIYRSRAHVAFIKGTLGFCGIKPIRRDIFDRVRFSTPAQRAKWLELAEKRGVRGE